MRKVLINSAKMTAMLSVALLVLAAPAMAGHFSTNACGASIQNETMSLCGVADCASWSANGRIFRDGVPAFCDSPKGCPGGDFNPGTTFYYQAYYFNTNETECECIVVDNDNGGCGTDVHFSLFEGVVDPGPTWACSMPPDGEYLADQGGSLATNDMSGSTTNEHLTVLVHNNFGLNQCNFSFSISCVPSESLTCALAPIEMKLDTLLGN